MENALSKSWLFSICIILIISIFSIQISLKQVEGQQSIFTPDNVLKEHDESLNTLTIVSNNIKNMADFFLGNIYAMISLILLAIFLVWSAKIVFGIADFAKPYFDGQDRFKGYGSFGGVDSGGGFGDGSFGGGGCHGDAGGGGGCH